MRGHFREAHDMRVQVDDDSERGSDGCEDEIHDDESGGEAQDGGEVDLQDDMENTSHDDDTEKNDQYSVVNDQSDSVNDENDIENCYNQDISEADSKPVDSDAQNRLKTLLYEDQVFPYYQAFQKVLHKYQEEAKIKFIIRTSEKYCGTQLDRLKYPKVKVRFLCGYGYQSRTMKSECPVSFWVRLKNSKDPSQACYVIKNFSTSEHNHTQNKPTIISILKTPEKQSIKQEEPDGCEDLMKIETGDYGAESDLNLNPDDSSLPKGTFHKDQVFPDYQVFQRVLAEYERQSNMRFTVRSSGSGKTDVLLDKDKFPKKYITLVCQHASRPKVLQSHDLGSILKV